MRLACDLRLANAVTDIGHLVPALVKRPDQFDLRLGRKAARMRGLAPREAASFSSSSAGRCESSPTASPPCRRSSSIAWAAWGPPEGPKRTMPADRPSIRTSSGLAISVGESSPAQVAQADGSSPVLKRDARAAMAGPNRQQSDVVPLTG